MRTSEARRPMLLFLAVALLLAACGPASATAFTASSLGQGEDGWRGIPIDDHRVRTLPDVTLLDLDSTPISLARAFAGSPTLLFFGYASCPDICPIHLAAIASGMRKAGVTTEQLDVVFVSVDPARDTPARIDEFLRHFDGSFVGLHGDSDVVVEALDALDLPGPRVEGPDPRGDGDLIGHPAQVIGFDSAGVARRVWPFGARRADWVNDLPLIVGQW